MRTYDLSPLYRVAVGFDQLQRQLDQLMKVDHQSNAYPPYNIEQVDENAYRITMAVAGFGESELDVTQENNSLVITGRAQEEDADPARTFLHRGIAGRAFERRFELADHIKVTGAELVNGLLSVDLVREVPEAMKPRKIAIGGRAEAKAIEQKAA
ncbi:MAG: Hsp20 family protein [Rhodospirillales bacterium]